MKKILLITLLLIPFFGFSQTTKPVEGFMGIKFGTSRADVLAAMKAKGLTQIEGPEQDKVDFMNPVLGNKKAEQIQILFVNDKACMASIKFKPDADDHAIITYNGLVDDITGVYGAGQSHRIFRGTFKDGDGYELTAIQGGDADYYTNWNRTQDNFIQLKITVKLEVMLNYVDMPLYTEYQAQQKAKNSF